MPNTPIRNLPYPADTAKVGQLPAQLQALAEALDGEWPARVSLAAKLVGPTFTVTPGAAFDIRRNGKDREIRGSITGTFGASATVTIATGLDAGDRPSSNSFAFAYMSGVNPGSAFIRSNGEVAVSNMTATGRTTAQFTIRYTVD